MATDPRTIGHPPDTVNAAADHTRRPTTPAAAGIELTGGEAQYLDVHPGGGDTAA
jgi:hypothetical protein